MQRPAVFDASKVHLPQSGGSRFLVGMGRSALRHCPYCGGAHIFTNWWTLKTRCPTCNVLYEYEEGYFVGAYAINLVITEVVAVLVTLGFLIFSGLSVLSLQIMGAALAIGLPIFFYPYAVLLWMVIDIAIHNPGDFTDRPRV